MDGCTVHLWVDRWLPSIPLGHPLPGAMPVIIDTRVASLIGPNSRS